MTDLPNNETRTRILNVAEELFSKRGYASVTLRDIATAVGMRHASLYYYVPGGKEQLFIEVMERNFHRHRAGMEKAIAEAGSDIREQVRAVAGWLVLQPPLDFTRMFEADMPAIDPQQAQRLTLLAYDSLRLPLATALEKATEAGLVDLPDFDLAALSLVVLIQSVHTIPGQETDEMKLALSEQMTKMLLNGWLAR